MSKLGQTMKATDIPKGFVVKNKGIKLQVYIDILSDVSELTVGGDVLFLSQEVLEEKMNKKLPKYFSANLNKKLVEKFGKGKIESVKLYNEDTKQCAFQIARIEE